MTNVVFITVNAGSPAPHPYMPALWLSRCGHDVLCLGPGLPSGTRASPALGTWPGQTETFSDAGLGVVGNLRFAARLLAARVRGRGGPLYYVHGSTACPAALVALLGVPRRRVIYHTQDFLEPGRHPHWEFFERRMTKRSGTVICNDPSRARFMASHYGLRGVPTVVRTALPRDWPVPARDEGLRSALLARVGLAESGRARLVWAGGSPHPVRCSRELMAAVAQLPPEYVLVFSGVARRSSRVARAKEQLRDARVESRCILLEPMPYAVMLRHAAACDVGALLYPDDGIGNFFQAPGRLTEYMACGLPFVTSRFPALELVAVKHRAGVACDPASPTEIASAIRQLCERDPETRSAERVRLRALARDEFAYDLHAERIVEAVRQVGSWQENNS